jgi:exosortase family protein XrtM
LHKKQPKAGIDYWPNQLEWTDAPKHKTKQPSLIIQALLFLLVFAILQVGWLLVRDNAFGHFIRGDMTVKPVVKLINFLSPQINAMALGNQIIAPGGGLVVKLGCEGVEALFILLAAFLITPLSRSAMLKGILFGTVLVYVLNQARILLLFYAFRADKPLFLLLHGTIAPIALIALAGLFFHWWLMKYGTAITQKQATTIA